MKIARVINNNTVVVVSGKKELVLMGSGIGFKKRTGDLVEVKKIEKVFQIRDKLFKKYEQIYAHIEPAIFPIVEQIQEYAQKELECVLSPQFVFSLADHIAFAVERQKNKERMPNLMLQEIKLLYMREYRIGEYGRRLVEKEMAINLPEDEAGYIALHIVNSRTGDAPVDVNNVLVLTNGILKILEDDMDIHCKPDDYEYNRFLAHLKFLARRVFEKEQIRLGVMDDLYPRLLRKEPRLEHVLGKIRQFIAETFDYRVSDEEAAYLAVHILRIKG